MQWRMTKEEREAFENSVTEYLEDISENLEGQTTRRYVEALIEHKGRYYLCTLGEPDEGGWYHANCRQLPVAISLKAIS